MRPKAAARTHALDAQTLLASAGGTQEVVEYARSETIFSQGDPADSVFYIQRGGVTLSVSSQTGREAVVAMLGPGDFCGEGGLAGQALRTATATALTPTTVLVIGKADMMRALHTEQALSDRFIAHMLSRSIRNEQDLVDQLFNSSEKRVASALLLLAGYGTEARPRRVLPGISPRALAALAGTTRSRVDGYLDKFTRLKFIEGVAAGLKINNSLLNVVLRD